MIEATRLLPDAPTDWCDVRLSDASPIDVPELVIQQDGEDRLFVIPVQEGARRFKMSSGGGDAPQRWLAAGGDLVAGMIESGIDALALPSADATGGDGDFEAFLLGALLQGFRMRATGKSKTIYVRPADKVAADRAGLRALTINRARASVAAPPNLLTPESWVEIVRSVLDPLGAAVAVLDNDALADIGAGALLAVGQGSRHGARLLIVEWRGDQSRSTWDVAMVGKGLTFDSGGLNLKPGSNIARMKLDMAGGAAVLGAIELAMQRRSSLNLLALVPIAENLVDGNGVRPGDVVTALDGTTIEVANTDAEGRLVLADAIGYAVRTYQPACLVDLATLTSAVMEVLHEDYAGLYCSDDRLVAELQAAGDAVSERLWRLPLSPDLDYLVASEVATLSNVAKAGFLGRGEGSPTAGAKFLERFARGTRWAHIDMCGTAWATRPRPPFQAGPTGFGVRLLDRWIAGLEADR